MKTPSLILLLLITSFCWSQQRDSIREISYSARTRGLFKVVLVDKQNTIIQTNDGFESSETPESYWQKLLEVSSSISLDQIKDLQAPSNERAHDAALSCKIEIHTDFSIYISSAFDEGKPPMEIKTLVTLLEAQFPSRK